MAKQPLTYEPPKQSAVGQIIDSIVILALVAASLFGPVYLGMAGAQKAPLVFAEKTWTGMKQNPVMQAQWEKLGFTPDTAAPIIADRFNYSVNWIDLLITGVVIVAYFVFLIRYSDKEYRDVIAERFNGK
jgi:hypothetical protein